MHPALRRSARLSAGIVIVATVAVVRTRAPQDQPPLHEGSLVAPVSDERFGVSLDEGLAPSVQPTFPRLPLAIVPQSLEQRSVASLIPEPARAPSTEPVLAQDDPARCGEKTQLKPPSRPPGCAREPPRRGR